MDLYDIEYRAKLIMSDSELELNEELMDSSKQKFIEVTMSSLPLVHKERVDFLLTHCMSYRYLSDQLSRILKIFLSNLRSVSILKLITRVRDELPHILNCQRCTLWAKDPTLNELYSYRPNGKEIRINSVDDIVGYVLNNM